MTAGATAAVVSTAGCTQTIAQFAGDEDDSADEDGDSRPDPEIVDATSGVQNFRQTDDSSRTLVIVRNNGGLGEFELTIQAIGNSAPLAEESEIFSLDEGQEFQAGFDLFTHQGARTIRLIFESTEYDDKTDTFDITEEETPENIDFSG